MKKKTAVLISSVLCLAMSVPAMAAVEFSDSNDVPWEGAKTYISRAAELGLMVGQENSDGTSVFRAKDQVTYCETMQLAYNLLKECGIAVPSENVTEKWDRVLEGYKIPQWAREAAAYCLENGLVDVDDIGGFMDSAGKSLNATRQDVAVIFGRALAFVYDADDAKEADFNDGDKLNEDTAQYVYLMADKGILLGDENSNFNPDKYINRAEMAVIATKTYNVLNGDDPNSGVEASEEPSGQTQSGTQTGEIAGSLNNITKDSVVVDLSGGERNVYKFASGVVIRLNGTEVSHTTIIDMLDNGVSVDVSVTLNDNGEAQLIEAAGAENAVSGELRDVDDDFITVRAGGSDRDYYYKNSTEFYFEDEKVNLPGFQEIFDEYGDNIVVSAQIDEDYDLEIVEAYMSTEGGSIYGNIKNVTDERVTVYLDGDTRENYQFDGTPYILLDGESVSLSKIERTVEDEDVGLYGPRYLNKQKQATKLDLELDDNTAGTIENIDEYFITIKTEAGVEKRYPLQDGSIDVRFGKDSSKHSLDDLENVYAKGKTEAKVYTDRDGEVYKITAYVDFDDYDLLRGTLNDVTTSDFTVKKETIEYDGSTQITINGEEIAAYDLYTLCENGVTLYADVVNVDGKAEVITASLSEAYGTITEMENNYITIKGNNETAKYELSSDEEGLVVRIDNLSGEYTYRDLYSRFFIDGVSYNVTLDFDSDGKVIRIYAETIR